MPAQKKSLNTRTSDLPTLQRSEELRKKSLKMSESDTGPNSVQDAPDADWTHFQRGRPAILLWLGKKHQAPVEERFGPHPLPLTSAVKTCQPDECLLGQITDPSRLPAIRTGRLSGHVRGCFFDIFARNLGKNRTRLSSRDGVWKLPKEGLDINQGCVAAKDLAPSGVKDFGRLSVGGDHLSGILENYGWRRFALHPPTSSRIVRTYSFHSESLRFRQLV